MSKKGANNSTDSRSFTSFQMYEGTDQSRCFIIIFTNESGECLFQKETWSNKEMLTTVFTPSMAFNERNRFQSSRDDASQKALDAPIFKIQITSDDGQIFRAINESSQLNTSAREIVAVILKKYIASPMYSESIKTKMQALRVASDALNVTSEQGDEVGGLETSRTALQTFPSPVLQIAGRADAASSETPAKKRKVDDKESNTPQITPVIQKLPQPTKMKQPVSKPTSEATSLRQTDKPAISLKRKTLSEAQPVSSASIEPVQLAAPPSPTDHIFCDASERRLEALSLMTIRFQLEEKQVEKVTSNGQLAAKVAKQAQVLDGRIAEAGNKFDFIIQFFGSCNSVNYSGEDYLGLIRFLASFEWVMLYLAKLTRQDVQLISAEQLINLRKELLKAKLESLYNHIESLMPVSSFDDKNSDLFHEAIDTQTIELLVDSFKKAVEQIDGIVYDTFSVELDKINLPESNVALALSDEQYPLVVRDLLIEMSLISDILVNMKSTQQTALGPLLQEFLMNFPIGLFRPAYSLSVKVQEAQQAIMQTISQDLVPIITSSMQTLSLESDYNGSRPPVCAVSTNKFKSELFVALELTSNPKKTMLMPLHI